MTLDLDDWRIGKMKPIYIKGMNIIPLDTEDIIYILKSDKKYTELKEYFYALISIDEDRGSLWYSQHIKPCIQNL